MIHYEINTASELYDIVELCAGTKGLYSYSAVEVIYDYLDGLDDYSFDPVEFRCQFTEYNNAKSLLDDYEPDVDEAIDYLVDEIGIEEEKLRNDDGDPTMSERDIINMLIEKAYDDDIASIAECAGAENVYSIRGGGFLLVE